MGRTSKLDADIKELKVTPIFFKNMECNADIIINRGSSGSSKSHSIIQYLTYKMLTEENKKILILRKSLPSLRISTLWMIRDIFDDFGITNKLKEEKVELNFRYKNNVMHMGSVDDPQKIKSTQWNYIWFEEATEFALEDFQIINLYNRAKSTDGKLNQIILSFNPVDEYHWIKTYLLKNANKTGAVYDTKDNRYVAQEIHSTYKDNPFLPKDTIRKLEMLQEQDYNHYRVYALGEWGKLGDLVYSNWDTCETIPPEGTIVYGLDWGYNDPTALIKCTVKGNHTFEEELIYRSLLTNSDVIKEIERVIPVSLKQRPIYCDSSRPDMIKELKQNGFNAKQAQKSILDGIDFVKRMKVHILESSTNIQNEKKAYGWKKDRNGHVIDEPIDANNHLMDAERYALYSHFGGGRKLRVRWL